MQLKRSRDSSVHAEMFQDGGTYHPCSDRPGHILEPHGIPIQHLDNKDFFKPSNLGEVAKNST